jgi:two-component system sensor histidine kinase SenX3
MLVWILALRTRKAELEAVATQPVQETVAYLLDVLATAGVVVDGSNHVVRATTGAQVIGLVQNRILIHSALVELVEKARTSGDPCEGEFELSTGLRNDSVWVHARAAVLKDGNVLLTVEDETESKRLEDTRRDFVANISHELKTPIGAISLLSEALVDAADDATMVKKFAGDLFRESRRLASLVQDIIQLSRLQSADIAKNAHVIDLSGVISEAVERNQVLAERRHVRISFDAPAGIKVLGDHEMLTMAVKNLIENAILYSDEGSQVGIGLKTEPANIAAISVTDNGVGIAQEHLERIFERFYRADPSRSRQTGGTGLGLSIVKHVALNHRGDIQVFSRPGLGSTFTLRLPIVNDQDIEDEQ